MEELAIFVCAKTCDGKKSAAEGIDLEFERDNAVYLVAIKSGPNWGNSSQIARMRDNFRKAKRILGTNAKARNVICVNGCCYGRETTGDKGDYLKLCGERFWTFISDVPTLYTDIIEPLSQSAVEHDDRFKAEYEIVLERFTQQFRKEFCDSNGLINWEELVRFNSGAKLG